MLLTPHWVFDDYTAVTPDFLRAHGVTLLLTDIDYTLAPKSVREPDDAVRAWLAALAAAGVTVAVLSNNRSPRRVQRFCAGLGIDFVGHAQKPSRRGYRRALEKFKTPQEHTAMLGDKLLTDILGAKRSGVLALMVEPKGGARGRVAEGAPCPAGAVQARERARRAHGAAIILQNLAQDRENYLQ